MSRTQVDMLGLARNFLRRPVERPSATHAFRWLSLVVVMALFYMSRAHSSMKVTSFMSALLHTYQRSGPSLSLLQAAVEARRPGLQEEASHIINSKSPLPFVISQNTRLCGFGGCGQPEEGLDGHVRSAREVDFSSFPPRSLLLQNGAYLEISNLKINGLHLDLASACEGSCLAKSVAFWLLHPDSQGTVLLEGLVLELASCTDSVVAILQPGMRDVLPVDVASSKGSAAEETLNVPDGSTAAWRAKGPSDSSNYRDESGDSDGTTLGDKGTPAEDGSADINSGGHSVTHSYGGGMQRLRGGRADADVVSGSALSSAAEQHSYHNPHSLDLHREDPAVRSSGLADASFAQMLNGWVAVGKGATVTFSNVQLACFDGAEQQEQQPQHLQKDLYSRINGHIDGDDSEHDCGVVGGSTKGFIDFGDVATESAQEAEEQQGMRRSRRSLLAPVVGRGRSPEDGMQLRDGHGGVRMAAGGGFGASASAMILMCAVLASVGGLWLKRLLSCACMGPVANGSPAVDPSRVGSRTFHKTSASMARNSQNHTLSALSRFSAQLRKGEDSSVRDISRRGPGSNLRLAGEGSVRGGAKTSPALPTSPPPLLRDLMELKVAGQGRLATVLQGIWQQQQRVVVKVLSHGEDCAFMMEQVGEVWTRLTHPNIVTCWAAETFAASYLAAAPEVAALLPKPADPDEVLQTWIVMERCENSSLATLLVQRHKQQVLLRKAAAASPMPSGGGVDDASKEGSQALHLAKRLGRFSRGRRKSTEPKDGAGPAGAGARTEGEKAMEAAPAGPPLAPTAFPAIMSTSPCSADEPSSLGLPSPSRRPMNSPDCTAAGGATSSVGNGGSGGGAGSGNASGTEDAGEASPPGLLPVAEMLSIAQDIASGLAYLHSLDLCHGDLRAENVLIQTVVLPSTARSAGNGTEVTGEGVVAVGRSIGSDAAEACTNSEVNPCLTAGDTGGLSFGDVRAARGGSTGNDGGAGLAGGCRTVDEGLAAMYGSTGGRSDATDASGAVIAGASGPARQALSNPSSCVNTTNASCAAQDSSAQAWSHSLRHSNGFMMGSTYASTVTIPTRSQAGVGGPQPSCSRGFDPSSVDDRIVIGASVPLQGGLSSHCGNNCYFAGRGSQPCNPTSGRSLLGAAAAAAQGTTHVVPSAAAAALVADASGAAAVHAEGSMPSNFLLSTSAVAALSRGIGLSTSALPRTGAVTSPFIGAPPALQAGVNSCTSLGRRQSNSSLTAHNTNSGNDVSAMSKALSGLTAWPESPPLESRQPTNAASVNAAGGGTANGSFAPSARSPGRRAVVGGLKSALSAPEVTSTPGHPATQPQQTAAAAAAAEPLTSYKGPSTGGSAGSHGPPSKSHAGASGRPTGLQEPLSSTCLPGDGSAAGSPPVAVMSPRALRVQLDSPGGSSVPPSPSAAAAEDEAAPPTPTGAMGGGAAAASGNGGGSRSRTAVGLVCNIAGHQGRRSSAPSLVALPVIRKVAKLSDPWLSLARMPADCAGGAWSPATAAAAGATSGADIAHLPPELLLSGRLHPSSDVYSLAILMWRMLSTNGEAPYRKLCPAEVAYKVVACGMRPAFSPAIPEPLRRLVEDCWQSDPAARPTVQQVLQRLTELQPLAAVMQRQWRERHALFGPVSTMPISAVAVMPLRQEQNAVAMRWADAAGIKLLRSSSSFGGSAAGFVLGAGGGSRGDLSGHASFGQNSGRGLSGTYGAPLYASIGVSGSAAHLYQQPPPPTPPGLPTTQSQFTTMELSNHSNVVSEAAYRGSQSNHQPTSPYTGHLPVQPYKRPVLEPF